MEILGFILLVLMACLVTVVQFGIGAVFLWTLSTVKRLVGGHKFDLC